MDENLQKNLRQSKKEKQPDSTQKSKTSVRNREFAVITYCFTGLLSYA